MKTKVQILTDCSKEELERKVESVYEKYGENIIGVHFSAAIDEDLDIYSVMIVIRLDNRING